ncbi:DNA-3-methyladenine glycosylase [Candidatus Kinetoplastibacterium sorsogonicusi]|uniref:DNA-3-methyladenine glycosylase II n=1 Tax=Candidatus Kinetoplastidibacterium kentomonadis TaxID=1576550 RepID=A0A3Q8ER48_9PROT|nr:DNA-3-methyladenine glycosylase [Candidatus Kinetoplastibacterium sorsogonicusi]AWD32297.1 DNA-3-methyladenine glycosylase [Candidatus Kinetoplastibacterium sorsogonicusi]
MEFNNKYLQEPIYWHEATSYLLKKDRILKKIIPLCNKNFSIFSENYFQILSKAIICQKISNIANETVDNIWNIFKNKIFLDPYSILITSKDTLKSMGVNNRKANYLYHLALSFCEKKVKYEDWNTMDNESIVKELLSIKGIGRWTAEIFLMFGMQRPDIMPLDDKDLLKAISFHYFSGEPVSRFEAREVSVAWKPWRTVASYYLWQSLNFLPIK